MFTTEVFIGIALAVMIFVVYCILTPHHAQDASWDSWDDPED